MGAAPDDMPQRKGRDNTLSAWSWGIVGDIPTAGTFNVPDPTNAADLIVAGRWSATTASQQIYGNSTTPVATRTRASTTIGSGAYHLLGTGSSGGAQAKIGMVLIYSRRLDDTEMGDTMTEIGNYYGITVV